MRRSTLYIKFIVIYLIFGFLSFFIIATLTSQLTLNRLEKETSSTMYQEANLIATDYLPRYFAAEIAADSVQTQLNGMKTYLQSSVWLVDTQGKMIVFSKDSFSPDPPAEVANFDPAAGGSKQFQISNYHNSFSEEVITVIAPVTISQDFEIQGYILIHKPYAHLIAERDNILKPVYITFALIYFLSFSILLGFQLFIFRPLRKITEAATLYASGDLSHEIPVQTQDEMGYLSASLNYMSTQLKDSDDYQRDFIANVSHDFRSPLTSIKGYVVAMLDGTIPPELQGKYLDIILFETERLTDLTKDLLTINEFNKKDLLLNMTNFDLHEVIKHTSATFEGSCNSKRISIELILAAKKLIVHGNQRKIQQVIYNLIDNAIKFSVPDSTIIVETTEYHDKVFISIKDHGIGIPKKHQAKVWERFYKTDQSRGKDKRGTGLGLAIVKEIIQAHGENINMVSTEGVGTEFTFSLSKPETLRNFV